MFARDKCLGRYQSRVLITDCTSYQALGQCGLLTGNTHLPENSIWGIVFGHDLHWTDGVVYWTVLGFVIVISTASAMDSIRPQTLFQVVSLRALAIASLYTWPSLYALPKA